jgi:2-polyprenyl-3-methyl-5-hydroxy-6-metoxy-1,4-benzoquinol methylase
MPSLREELVDDYARHFTRLNATLETSAMSAADFAGLSRTFGDVVAQLPQGAKILDLGCGTGYLLNWLVRQPGIAASGVDGSPTQLEIARRNLPNVEFTCSDGLTYLRENPDTFDGIFCTDVLEHIPGTELVIEWVQTARAALRPGGFFICRGPNAANFTGGYTRYIDLTHERSFTEKSILQLLDAGGLQGSRILPIHSGTFGGRVRQWFERIMHQIIYRICGQSGLSEFSYNICAVGFRRD